jgi:hypothetical protein
VYGEEEYNRAEGPPWLATTAETRGDVDRVDFNKAAERRLEYLRGSSALRI